MKTQTPQLGAGRDGKWEKACDSTVGSQAVPQVGTGPEASGVGNRLAVPTQLCCTFQPILCGLGWSVEKAHLPRGVGRRTHMAVTHGTLLLLLPVLS